MPKKNSELRHKAIQRTLVQRAAGALDANAVAEATLSIWSQIADRLAPLIGARGADALFNRSLFLSCKAFPCLFIAGDHRDSAALLASLKARLASCETDAAVEASHALLVTFTELLASFIGESLTERLLGSIWESSSPTSEQENIA